MDHSFQLDVALEEVETQRNGLVFIYNMTSSKYSNFDYDLSQKMLTLLKGKLCSRLSTIQCFHFPLIAPRYHTIDPNYQVVTPPG